MEDIEFLHWTTAEGIELPPVEPEPLNIQLFPFHEQPLRFQAKPFIEEADVRHSQFREFVAKMVTTMYNPRRPGIGLAANQVAFPYQVCVVDHQWTESQSPLPKVLLNPQIVEGDGEIVFTEGCLSVPGGFRGPVHRKASVLVRALTLNWEPIEFEAVGLEAVVLQHEIDHLNGTIFLDHLSRLRRDIFNRKVRKVARIGYKRMKKVKKGVER